MEIPFTPDLGAFVTWLAMGGGSLVLVMWFVSWGLVNVKFWLDLPSKLKSFLILFVSILFSVGSYYLLQFPALLAEYDAIFKIVLGLVIAWTGSQVAYLKARNVSYVYGARGDEATKVGVWNEVPPPVRPEIDA
jgi:hypothetical protein